MLGDISIRDAAGVETAPSAQRREILAAIAAAAGSIVPQETLLRGIWGEVSDSAKGSLKTQLSTIRRHLDRGLTIEWVNRAGYRLKGPLELLDATAFEQLATSARDLPPADAAVRYAQALSMWRAPLPFLNVDSTSLVDAAVWRLVALRDEVIRSLADCEIACRHGAVSLPLLEQLFTDDPRRSDITARLATLYALNGRHSHGLATINAHRDALANIGAVISPEVAEVDAQILRYELGPSSRNTVTREVDAYPVANTMLQRHRQVERIIHALRDGSVVVTGEAGVGKTVVTHLTAQRLAEDGVPVLRVAVLQEPFRPLQTIASLLDQLHTELPDLTTRLLRNRRLADAFARVSRPDTAEVPPTTRDDLVADLAELITAAVAGSDAVVVVEDTHWLDATSAEILLAVVGHRGVRALLTSRPQLHEQVHEWVHAVAPVSSRRDAAVTRLELPPFDLTEVSELLRVALPMRATVELAASLHHQTGGNPLFLGLLLDVLSRGELGRDVPLTLQAAIQERTSALSRNGRGLLQLASLLGPTFPLAPLRQLRKRAGDHLTEAEEEGLVACDAAADLGQFVHGLVADALVASIPAAPRVSWHDELCRALQRCGFSAVAAAPHALGAAALDPIRAARVCADAANEHAALFEWQLASDWAQHGLDVVERHRMQGQLVEAELSAVLGTGRRRLGRPGSDLALRRAAELAAEYEANELHVRCVVELCLHGLTTTVGTTDADARRHLDHALSLALGDHRRAELLAASATLLASSPDVALARRLYREARAIALRSEDERLVRTVLMNAHLGLAHPDDLSWRHDAADRLATMEDVEARWEAEFLRVGLGIVTADRALVDRSVANLRDLTPLVRQRNRARALLQVEAVHAFLCGDLEAAERWGDQAFHAAVDGYSQTWALSIYSVLLFPVRMAQGRAGEFWDIIQHFLRDQPDYTTWFALGAIIADAGGDGERTVELLDVLRSRDLAIAEDSTYTAALTQLCVPVWRTGARDLAAELQRRLAPYRGQMTWNGLSTHGPVDAGLALCAATLGETGSCADHLATARTLVDRFGAPHLWWPELDALAPRDRTPQHPDR